MPTSDVYFGRYRDTPDYEFGWVKSGQIRVQAFGSPSKHLWVESFGFYGGEYEGSTPTASMAAYELSGKNPTGDRVGYSVQITPTNDFDFGHLSGGQVKTLAIALNDKKPSATGSLQAASLQFWKNKGYGIGLESTSGETSHGMNSKIIGYNNRFYQRNGIAQPPPANPDPYNSQDPQGTADFWVKGQYNVEPLVPSTTTMTPSGDIDTDVPTFTGVFRDLNGTYGTGNGGKNLGDNMQGFQVLVFDDDDALVWDSGFQEATLDERIANEFSIVYNGVTLNRGDTYRQQCRVMDQFDAWSDYSDLLEFTLVSAGIIYLEDDPTGRITTVNPAFEGSYSHPDGLAMTHVQVKVVNQNGALVAESPQIAKAILSSASPGTDFTISWVEAALGIDLTWGASYYYMMRTRDSAGEWSNYPAFTKNNDHKVRSFRVNSAPNSPTNLAPTNGIIRTTRPELTWDGTDDDQDSTTGLLEYARIKSKENILNPTMAANASNWAEQYKDTGWTYAASRDAAVFQDAAGSMKIAVTNAPATTAKLLRYTSSDWLPCVAGETYLWATYVRKDNALLFVRPVIVFENSSGTEQGVARTTDPGYTINTWNRVEVSGVAPATAVRMKVGIELYNAATGAVTWNAWIDSITPLNWQVRSYKQATYSSGKWRYQTTSGDDDVVGYAEYRWDTFAYDGYIYSGRKTTAADAQKSQEYAFTYALGPSIVIDTPNDLASLSTSRLEVEWTAATQTKYRVVLLDLTKGLTAYDTGLVTDAVTKSIVIPAGKVRNGRSYRLTVSVKDASNLDGEDVANLTADFDESPPLANFSVTGYSFPGDAEPSGVIVNWDQTTLPLSTWRKYVLERIDPTGERSELKQIFSPSQTEYIDSTPVSGVPYIYELYQLRRDGLDDVPSEVQTGTIAVDLPGTTLSSVLDPDSLRVMMHFRNSQSNTRKKDVERKTPLAGPTHPVTGEVLDPKPVTLQGAARWWEIDGEYELVTDLADDADITAQFRYDQLDRMDISGDILCYRDERGFRKFVTIDSLVIVYKRPDSFVVRIKFVEESYYEVYVT